MSKPGESRSYPLRCLSAMCGKSGDGCNGCEHKRAKDAFWRWVRESGAVQPDPIWMPNFYRVPLAPGQPDPENKECA